MKRTNLRFFGDSWFWTWYWPESLKSKAVKKWSSSTGFSHTDALPTLSPLLKTLGYNAISYNKPGMNFYDTVDRVLYTKCIPDTKFNVIFFSNLFRYENQLKSFDVSNYKNFMDKWLQDLQNLLVKLQQWAEENNQEVIIVGGQCTLFREHFDLLKNKKGIHLLSECITHQIIHEYFQDSARDAVRELDGKIFGIFKLPNFYPWIDTSWDKKLVDHIYEDSNLWNDIVVRYNIYSPDNQHATVVGQIFFIDLLLQKVEEIQGEKIESNCME